MEIRAMTKRFLNVAYEDRDLAKRLGARWDPALKRWYYAKGSPLAKVFGWRAVAADGSATTSANDPTPKKQMPPPTQASCGDLFDQPVARYG